MGPGGGFGPGMGMGGPGDPNNGDNPGGIQTAQGGRGGPRRTRRRSWRSGWPADRRGFGGRGGGPGGPGGFGGGRFGGGRLVDAAARGARARVAAEDARAWPLSATGGGIAACSTTATSASPWTTPRGTRRATPSPEQVDKPAYAKARATMMFGGPLKIPAPAERTQRHVHLQLPAGAQPQRRHQHADHADGARARRRFLAVLRAGAGHDLRSADRNPFPGNIIPTNRINPTRPAAQVLSAAEFRQATTATIGAHHAPSATATTSMSRLNQTLNRKNRLNGGIGYQGSDNTTPNIFGFIDTRTSRSMNYQRQLGPQLHHPRDQQSELPLQPVAQSHRRRSSPTAQNVAGELGITGHLARPASTGARRLCVHQLRRAQRRRARRSRATRPARSARAYLGPQLHNITFGGDYRRQQINPLQRRQRARHVHLHRPHQPDRERRGRPGHRLRFRRFPARPPGHQRDHYGNADKYFRNAGYDAVHDRRLALEHQVLAQRRHPLGLQHADHASCTTAW